MDKRVFSAAGNKTKSAECVALCGREKIRSCIMRKMFFALAVAMLATPVWATVTITANDLGEGVVAIDYSSDDAELVRAFALDITVDVGTIEAVGDFNVGDNNNGYGIFPGNFSRYITVDPVTGEVTDWGVDGYTPVADGSDPGALGGLGTNGITIEMGSLYDTKAPPKQGRLCTVTCSETCLLTVTTNATRGNVVLEDASEATVDLAGATNYQSALVHQRPTPVRKWTNGLLLVSLIVGVPVLTRDSAMVTQMVSLRVKTNTGYQPTT